MVGEGEKINATKIAAVIILGVAAIVLTSIAISTQYSRQLRITTGIDITDTDLTTTIGGYAAIGTTGLYPFLQTVTDCINSTGGTITLPSANYTVSEGNAGGGGITLTQGTRLENDTVNCSITYLANSAGQRSADKFIAGQTIFGTFMAVIVLALVGMVIISLFKKKD